MCPTLRRTAVPARSHCLRSARTRRVGRARRDGAGLPRGAPRPSRRAQRAQRALPEAGSVPCAAAHSRASSISPPAISADATRRPDDAGRCGTVVMGDRAWWRPSAKGAQELRRLHKHLELRRHRWHCGTSPLGKTSDWRDAHRPWSAFLVATGPLRHPLALGRHVAATGRSDRARGRAVGMFLGGINGEGRARSRELSFPGHDAQAEHVRALP